MNKNPEKMSKNIRRVLCYTLGVLLFATISVMAQTQGTLCSAHMAHDEDCGYVEAVDEVACDMECTDTLNGEVVHQEGCAYTEAVEPSDCTHSCELCDPKLASELSMNNAISTDSVTEETDVAQAADEAEATTDTTEDATDATDESEATTDEATADESESDAADSSNASEAEGVAETAESAEESDDVDESEQQAPIATLSNGDGDELSYEITLENDYISNSQPTINLVTETTGTLQISAGLPMGEIGRYIDVYLPDYGMALSSTLPSPDGDITSVEVRTRTVTVGGVSNIVEYLRLYIANSVDATLEIGVSYVTSTISNELDALWGELGSLPETGFKVVVYNEDGDELSSATYGEWVPENVDTDDAFTTTSQYSSYIPNYPDVPNYYADSSDLVYTNGCWYMQISVRNLYDTSYEVRRENLKSIRIYVPSPSVAVVTSISVSRSTTGIDSLTLESFDDAVLQQNAEGYYYELNFTNTDNSYRVDYSGYINIYVYLKKAEGSTAEAGETLGSYRMVLTTRTYGSETHTYEETYTPRMKDSVDVSVTYAENMGYYAYQYYGGNGVSTSSDVSSTRYAHPIEAGSTENSDVMGSYQVSGIATLAPYPSLNGVIYSSSYPTTTSSVYTEAVFPTLEGSTETWTFPYEIQPTGIEYQLYWGNYGNYNETFATVLEQLGLTTSDIDDVLEVTYTTSGGETYTAKLTVDSDDSSYLYIDFDKHSSGERVTSVTTQWKQWVEYATAFIVNLSYDVPATHEDTSAMESSEQFQVRHVWEASGGATITDSTDTAGGYTHIWFVVTQQYCPQLTWSGDLANSFAIEGVLMDDSTTYTNLGTLKVNESHANAELYMDTVTDPQIKLGFYVEGVNNSAARAGWATDVQTTSMFLTGEMTVMPFLAGWTITYTTANTEGDQYYYIPDYIPDDGLAIEIPIDDNDRFTSVLVFSYEGEVDGWSAYPELIKNVGYALYRTGANGNSVIAGATNSELAESYLYRATLYGYFCSSSCSGMDGSHGGSANNIYTTSNCSSTSEPLVDFVYNVVVTIGAVSESSVSLDGMYQGYSGDLNISVTNSLTLAGNASTSYWGTVSYFDRTSLVSLMRNAYGITGVEGGGSSATVAFPYESSPTFYVQLLTDEVTYMLADVTTTFGYPDTGYSASVDFVTAEDGTSWLKITPNETALAEANDSIVSNIAYISWSLETALYAMAGATTGNIEVIGDIYLDLHVQELEERFDGTNDEYQHLVYKFDGLVADEHGLLGDDTEAELLYQINTDGERTSTQVIQQIFSGVTIYPGTASNGYDTDTRTIDVYNHDADGDLLAMVTITAGREDLMEYDVTVYLPREGEDATGTLLDDDGTGSLTTVASEFDMWLTDPVSVTNLRATGVVITYIVDGNEYDETDVENWSEVEAIHITIETLPSMSAVTLTLSMAMNEKDIDLDGQASYLSSSYSFKSSSGQSTETSSVLGQYVFHIYRLSGVVWYDPDENGEKDTSEEGMEGITLTVRRSDGTKVDDTRTNANGEFSLELEEGENLYIEITLPDDGYKLTAQSLVTNITASDTDSDFNRTTNTVSLPETLQYGTYEGIGAGLVKLPVIDVSTISVKVGEMAAATASFQWDYVDYGYGTATLRYEQAENPDVATVNASNGTVTGVATGETTAVVWMQNTLGDRVEAEYQILVGIDPVSFTLIKELTEAAYSDETFVFKVTDEDDNSFYVTLTVAQGATRASVQVVDLAPGSYTVTELDTNWRYSTSTSQSQTLSDENGIYRFTFTSEKTNNYWVSDNDKVTNTMQSTG